jgi:hypothetical protein
MLHAPPSQLCPPPVPPLLLPLEPLEPLEPDAEPAEPEEAEPVEGLFVPHAAKTTSAIGAAQRRIGFILRW